MRETPIDPDIINSVFTAPVQEEHPHKESLINLVESLPENHKNVVELIVWGQMTKVDVAKKLGFSLSYPGQTRWAETLWHLMPHY